MKLSNGIWVLYVSLIMLVSVGVFSVFSLIYSEPSFFNGLFHIFGISISVVMFPFIVKEIIESDQ